MAASHNEVYLEVYDSLLGLMEHNMRGRPVGSECSYEREHTALVEGVIGGDAEAAKVGGTGPHDRIDHAPARVQVILNSVAGQRRYGRCQ